MTHDDTRMADDDSVMTNDDSVDARVVRHLEPLWWRPSLQITGLALWGLGMLLGWYVQKPRAIPDIDMRILESFSQDRSPALITLSRWIELYDGPKVTPWLLVGALVVVFALGHRLLAILAVVMTALSWFPGHLAKRMFPRERPPESIDPVWIVEGANSYPSGHTGFIVAATIAGVFAWTVLRRPTVRRWWIVGGTLMILLVAWSRVFVGVHYPTDVLGGALLDGGMALVLWPIWAGLQATIPEKFHALGDRTTADGGGSSARRYRSAESRPDRTGFLARARVRALQGVQDASFLAQARFRAVGVGSASRTPVSLRRQGSAQWA